MEIGTWIILILFYLVSALLRKRRRVPQTEEKRVPGPQSFTSEEDEREVLPSWLKEALGFEEETAEQEVRREELQQIIEPETEEEIPLEPGIRTKAEPEVREFSEKRDWTPQKVRLGKGAKEIRWMLKEKESLKNVIVVKEILGPPRAFNRYSWRSLR